MIHASSHRRGVIMRDLRQPCYEGAFVVAKRLFELQYPQRGSIRNPSQFSPLETNHYPQVEG